MAAIDVLNSLYPQVSYLSRDYMRNEMYYRGEIRPEAMGLALPPEIARLQTVVNWSSVVVKAIAERLRVQGFRIGKDDTANDDLWDIWESNELDHYSNLAHVEALVQGRCWVTVDVGEDYPIVMPESADSMAVDIEPKTRTIRAAVRRWYEYDTSGKQIDLATVYEPDATTYFIYDKRGWTQYDENRHGLGKVLVFPMVNDSRLPSGKNPYARWGVSELNNTIPLVDAACRSLTNLQAAQEFLAVPSRYVLGVPAEEFTDQNGNAVDKWEAYIGRFNALDDPDGTAKIVQLSGADLQNFTTTLNTYAKLISSVSAVPLRFFGVSSDANPASAEAIAADEGRHVMKCWEKTKPFGSAWEKAMQAASELAGNPISDRIECWWADPATPTFAAKAAALAQLFGAGLPLPRSYVYDVLDFTPEQRAQAESESSTDPLIKLLGANGQPSAADVPQPDGQPTASTGGANPAVTNPNFGGTPTG